MKNITLSIPKELLEKSRKYSAKQGTSLNQLVRNLLKKYTDEHQKSAVDSLIDKSKNNNSQTSWKWNRDELYER